MRRIVAAALVATLILGLCPVAKAVETSASSAILMDGESRRVLYAQDIHTTRHIASITKLMTALVAVEQGGNLDQVVTIRAEWLGSEGSSIYLQAGEQITLEGLIYGLLLQSGNDAASAIACQVAGDQETFVEWMNQRAAELGMEQTHFENPSGLTHEEHYSSAYDMALLALACLENPVVSEICATQRAVVGERTFYNHNKLLARYDGCVGMKTGYTEAAGRTLVSAAQREGQTLVCVTLNDGDDWDDHERLLNYGFSTYPEQTLCRRGDVQAVIPVEGSLLPQMDVVAEEDVFYPLKEGEKLICRVYLPELLCAPVTEGAVLGTAVWELDGEPVVQVNLVSAGRADSDLAQPSLLHRWLSRLLGQESETFGQGAGLI